MNVQKMSRMVTLLRVLVYVLMIFHLVGIVGAFVSDQDIYLEIGGTLWQQKLSAFSITDQVMIALIMLLPTGVLMWGLYQLIKLCRLFDTGIIFAPETTQGFKRFAIALIILSILETLATPLLVGYLWVRESIPAFPDFELLNTIDILETDLFAFGVLFL